MPSENKRPDREDQSHDVGQQLSDLQKALRESEERFRAISDSAPVGIFIDDTDGNAIFINRKCGELIGVPPQNLLDFNWIPFLHPDDRDRMVSEWKKAFTNKTAFRLEYRWVHQDGKVVWTLGEVVPVVDENGNVSQFIGTLTDITARKQAELEKEKLQEQLSQAQKMESIGRLAGGVAHDYNNMVHVILGYTEQVMDEIAPSEPVHQKLREIYSAAKRSAEVTRQLLTFARKQMVSPKVFDIKDSVNDILNMLQRLIGEHIDLVWHPQAPSIPIKMDPSQLDQIVMNLCINARDAITDAGTITIQTARVAIGETDMQQHRETTPGNFALLSVSDDGIGMEPSMLETIFEPFFTTKEKNMGTGLGLATVYGIVKQNNGFIEVDSAVGTGTTFRIYLPLYTGQVTDKITRHPASIAKGKGEVILIVEDEIAILKLTQLVLKKHNYKVLAANTVSEALQLAGENEIRLLITDVIMPKINGLDLARKLRACHPDLQCLFMSGYTPSVMGNDGDVEQNDDFIQKPFTTHNLLEKVNELLHPG